MDIIKPDFDELKQILKDYLSMIAEEGLPPVIDVERNFEFKINGHLLRGFIDRTDLIEDGYYHVVDYKTNKNPKYLEPFQLKLYALAIKEMYPNVNKIRGSYCLLKHKSRMKTWEFSDADLEDAKNKIINVGSDILVGNKWEKKPTILCNWCDYQSICQNNKMQGNISIDDWADDINFE